MKLVGYTEAVHQLVGRFSEDASILLFGGLAKDRPYPGSTTVTSVNGAVATVIRSLRDRARAHPRQRDPPRDRGRHRDLERPAQHPRTCSRARRPVGTSRRADIVDASLFLLENPAMNGVNLEVDGGWMML